jgi:hypothetical protein
MNHPKPEEWVAYMYGETPGTVKRELREHLNSCDQCREEIGGWQRSLKGLDTWKLPRARSRQSKLLLPMLSWAAAAAIILLLGIVIGRATSPKLDVEKLRQAIAPRIADELRSELAEVARDEAAHAGAITLASSRRYTDQVGQQVYDSIKKDVDTLALNTDMGLHQTAQQLYQLADYKEPQTPPTSNQ